jgi:hypothetical protein
VIGATFRGSPGDDAVRMTSVGTPGPAAALLGAIEYARQGIDRGFQSYEQAAQQVAGAIAARDVPSPSATVGLLEARIQVAAAAKVLERVDRGLGSLLDVRA